MVEEEERVSALLTVQQLQQTLEVQSHLGLKLRDPQGAKSQLRACFEHHEYRCSRTEGIQTNLLMMVANE